MKSRFSLFFAAAVALLLLSCATLLGPREVTIPTARLQEALANRFPFNNRYLDLLDVNVSNPHIALQPESDRILTSMDTTIAPIFLGKPLSGSIAVSGQLRVDTARHALILVAPRVEKFSFNGQDLPYANVINKVGSLLVEQLLQNAPLYTFKPEDFHYAGTSFMPTKIATRTDGLVVTFEPSR